MRCHEARRRISEIGQTDSHDADQKELLEHLQTCPGCALRAQASQELQQALAEAREHDTEGGLSWAETMVRVESKTALAETHQPAERPLMAMFKNQLIRRPRLGFGICAAALVVLAVTLIPFKYNRDMGFEVAIAGVDKDVALNSEGISQMMAKLGLGHAVVDVTGCDVTCNLKISDLKSQHDAQLVAAAFEEAGKNKVFVNIKLVREEASGNLLAVVGAHKQDVNLENVQESKAELHNILVERLGEGFEHNLIFIGESSADGDSFNITLHDSVSISAGGFYWTEEDAAGDEPGTVLIEEASGITFNMQECGELINEDGSINEETLQKLRDKGFEVEITEDADGEKTFNLYRPEKGTETELEDAAKSSDELELPEGFALSQNYPNPFNPTTRIDYSLPSAQHVTLEIYNIQGQKVRTLVDETVGAGEHSVEWDATSDAGTPVATGVYLYRLTAGDLTESKKMSFVK